MTTPEGSRPAGESPREGREASAERPAADKLNEAIARAETAESRLAQAVEALRPFAAIRPSSLYPEDGSEAEKYMVLLGYDWSNPVAFTGADLTLARTIVAAKGEAGSTGGAV